MRFKNSDDCIPVNIKIWNFENVIECVGISNGLDNVKPEWEIYIFVVKNI